MRLRFDLGLRQAASVRADRDRAPVPVVRPSPRQDRAPRRHRVSRRTSPDSMIAPCPSGTMLNRSSTVAANSSSESTQICTTRRQLRGRERGVAGFAFKVKVTREGGTCGSRTPRPVQCIQPVSPRLESGLATPIRSTANGRCNSPVIGPLPLAEIAPPCQGRSAAVSEPRGLRQHVSCGAQRPRLPAGWYPARYCAPMPPPGWLIAVV